MINSTSSFYFKSERHDLKFRETTLLRRTYLADKYVQLRLTGNDLEDFDSPGCDDHVRLFFPQIDSRVQSLESEKIRDLPSREYTPVKWSPREKWVDFEFVLHDSFPGKEIGSSSIGSRWAADAPIGSHAIIGGPRGSKTLSGSADSFFLAGDETAIPAIRRYIELLSGQLNIPGQVVIEHSKLTEVHLENSFLNSAVNFHYLDRENTQAGSALSDYFQSLTIEDRPVEGSIFGFIAAEQQIVKPARELLFDRWNLNRDSTIIKGYWKNGTAEYHAPH